MVNAAAKTIQNGQYLPKQTGMIPLRNGNNKEFIPMKKDFLELENQSKFMEIDKTPAGPEFEQEKRQLREVTKDFEAIFIRKLLGQMRRSMGADSMFGSGAAGDIYSDIVDGAVADDLADSGMLGLADQLYGRMIERLEIKHAQENRQGEANNEY